MSEREPKIQSIVIEEVDILPFIGTVSAPMEDRGFPAQLSAFTISAVRRHPSHPELHEPGLEDSEQVIATYEDRLSDRFSKQCYFIDYFDIASEILADGPNPQVENAYNNAWMRFITELELEPRTRIRSLHGK